MQHCPTVFLQQIVTRQNGPLVLVLGLHYFKGVGRKETGTMTINIVLPTNPTEKNINGTTSLCSVSHLDIHPRSKILKSRKVMTLRRALTR